MKKQKLLLVAGIVLATKIGFSQSNNLKIGGQDLDNGDYVGSNNNKNLTNPFARICNPCALTSATINLY